MTTDTTAGAPAWASNADPIGDLAIRLAARAVAVEEEHGEWAWRDIASAALQPGAADMVLVPREPTEAMVEAFWDRHAQAETVFAEPADLYRAMLAAAPTAFEGGKKA